MVYLDNAATSFPKPQVVVDAVRDFMLHIGANPGRSGHRLSADASRVVFDAREALAQLLGVGDSRRVVFTQNATEAINLVLRGMLHEGDHVVTTLMEHNSVMRPLRWLATECGVTVTVVPADSAGRVKPGDIAAAVTGNTRLVVVNHASNVTGTIAPIAGIKSAIGAVPLLVDAAQTAGVLPIDMERDGIDLLACTGHKGLLGPTGTGCLCLRAGMEEQVLPLIRGGTGSRSESDEQPDMLPDQYEGGTRNAAGIAGLGAGVRYLQQRGVDDVRRHEQELTGMLLEGLQTISGISIQGSGNPREQVATVSINVKDLPSSEVALALDHRYNIMVRAGLHCAPNAHRTIGTFPDGTVRLGMGALSTAEEVGYAIEAVREIAKDTS